MPLTPKLIEFDQVSGFLGYEDYETKKSITFEPGDMECIIPLNEPVACKAKGHIPCFFVVKNEGVEIAHLARSETKNERLLFSLS